MAGDVWFVVLPDGDSGSAAAWLLSPWATEAVAHHSGRPWVLGSWPDGYVTVGAAGARRLAVIGRCPVTAGELSARAGRVRDLADVERAARDLTGSFHLLASVDGRVRARGSASGVRRLFHARVGGAVVAADRADRLASAAASATGAGPGVDEGLLALHLLTSPLPYPLDERCVWRGVQGLRLHDCLLIEADGRARPRRWWTPPEAELTLSQGVPAVREALTTAVRACTAGGGTVSSDLSGGMDSTSLCFLTAHEQDRSRPEKARLVTLRWRSLDPDNDDDAWAAHATAMLPGVGHVTPSPHEWPLWYSGLTDLTGSTVPTDEPGPWVRDSARITTAARLMTARGSRLHMTGGGGDELFSALPPHLHDYVRSHPLAAFARLRAHRDSQHWPLWPLLRRLADRRTFAQWLAAWADSLTEPEPPPTTPSHRAPSTAWGVDLRMPSWATPDAVRAVQSLLREAAGTAEALAPRRGQHTALACVRNGGRGVRQLDHVFSREGLAYAAPYLDDQVLDAALAIRVSERSAPGRYKPVLAAAMDGIVPGSVLRRRTKGEYSVDFHHSLRHNRAALVELFDDSHLARAGLIDAAAVRTSLLGVHPTPDALRSLGPSLGSEIWLRTRAGNVRPPSPATTLGAP
ncbi:asparagine synthase-related protein [Streptomyces sp. HU2014]|uniref:asparagine synthase-related protein n=1 Tax=Streptomyces sp. HU2014 TaxID=2939414 RepID=UPI00200D846C|nr:asparagine synthase-related protein [Streptomyces sp. HU2014]UQI45802.1 asparagine synthase-related protein [Streptomyces sp. HU2014]